MSDSYYIDPKYSDLGYDGNYTFAGILRKHFPTLDQYSRSWNESTAGSYLNDYNNRILPAISALFGLEKPMATFTDEEFEAILEELNRLYHYSDNTLQHYRFLLWIVYRAGFDHGHYEDAIFWDDLLDNEQEEDKENQRVTTMTRTRKSFGIDEEIQFIEWFHSLTPETATGEEIGLSIMFFEGLRNNEACGLNVGSFHPLSAHQDVPVLDMYQSTKLDSNELKIGGKTRNAPRILPLFMPLYKFLVERRKFLNERIADGTIRLTDQMPTIDRLPLVCRMDNYTVRASAHDLTMVGRRLFDQFGISKRSLGLLQSILFSQDFRNSPIEEKDATTYLFRRNCATHLYHLSFSSPEIQYWMGHDIEDPVLTRNSFADEDMIYTIAQKFNRHPAYVFFENTSTTSIYREHDLPRQAASSPSDDISIEAASIASTFFIKAEASEPRQSLSVSVKSTAPFTAVIQENYPEVECTNSAVINGLKTAVYRRFGGKR